MAWNQRFTSLVSTHPSFTGAPRLPDESARLAVLRDYDILDTPPEIAFDRITRLAARIFEVPIALVSLVDDDRQWFKSNYGLDRRETSRDLSFCAWTILSDAMLHIPDATADPRFRDNALVTGPPFMRSYLGAPLTTPGGQRLGSLCLIDTVPREYGEDDRELLRSLAAMVMDELELRRVGRALRVSVRANEQLSVAIASAPSGIVITDPSLPDNPITFANPAFEQQTGYAPEEVIGRNCRFLQGPETDPDTVQDIRLAIAERRPLRRILRNYRKDGTSFLNELTIAPVFDENDRLTSFVGLQNDVTDREAATSQLEQRVAERTAELAEAQVEILSRLARAAEYRDDDTGQHTQRVARTSALLARALGLPEEHVLRIEQAAPLHDVGKIAVSDLILLKPGRLTDDELEIMRSHAVIGAAMLSAGRSDVVRIAERIAGAHHERWDGAGYPLGLEGEDIPLEGRILAVADVFDALTHARPYKKAWAVADAVEEIAAQAGRQFDPAVVDAFMTLPHADLVSI